MSASTTARIASQVGPAVIGLRSGSRGGSGVIVAPGVAVTLARNIREDELTVRVGGSDRAARVTGSDPTVDLAVLMLEGPGLPEPIAWAIGEGVTIGSEVYALADPAGRGLRVTPGTVSRAPSGLRGPSEARRLRAAVGLEPIGGLLVQAVETGGPADRAGIARGDVIVAIDDVVVSDPDPLYAALDAANLGEVALKIVRGSQELVLTARLGDQS